jgi:hypothetical protein
MKLNDLDPNLGAEDAPAPRPTKLRRFRATVAIVSTLFLLTGIVELGKSTLPLLDPLLTTARYSCDPCRMSTNAMLWLDSDEMRQQVRADPEGPARLAAHLQTPSVKTMLFLSEAVRAVPFFLLFVAIAMGLRSLAAGGFSQVAIRWLRRSALAAVAWTLAQPIGMSIRWTALSPITHGRPLRHIVANSDTLLVGLLISGAAWAVAWALKEAYTMRRDLEEYV